MNGADYGTRQAGLQLKIHLSFGHRGLHAKSHHTSLGHEGGRLGLVQRAGRPPVVAVRRMAMGGQPSTAGRALGRAPM